MSPFFEDALTTFRRQKERAERAMAQLNNQQLHEKLAPDTNSIAVMVQHMAGNMRSRWTEFLTSDGETPWRDRDSEFEPILRTREEVIETWEAGWATVFEALQPLTDADADRQVTIRGVPHSVRQAVLRQIDHYGYHVSARSC
jgi:hypothetical protein